MALAIFDLDNTLLADDSDYLWGCFLVDKGLVDRKSFARENHRFFEEYKAGSLDIHEFLRFQLRPLAEHDMATLNALRAEFMETMIGPIILPKARALLAEHRGRDATLLIITATNSFITGPIADTLGVHHLIATEPEVRAGRFTGAVAGIPCFQDGKVTRLNAWLAVHGQTLEDSWFYSDSHNDLPLLQMVEHPVAVDPDETLASHARRQGWPVISLRDGERPTDADAVRQK